MLLRVLARILIVAIALIGIAEFIPGITIDGVYPAIISALILGILNAIVRPILIVLTLPVSIVTLGLFVFVINASLFWFVASFIEGFAVAGFVPALVGSVLLSVIGALSNSLVSNTGRSQSQ